MKEATPTVGKLIPPTLNKRAVNNNKAPKQTTPQEVRNEEMCIQSFTRKKSI